MLRLILILFILTFTVSSFGQVSTSGASPIKTVKRIFNDYVKYSESTDSKDHKEAMKIALQKLQLKNKKGNLKTLLNVWMYYDPTDFPTAKLIMPILEKDKKSTLKAINKRIKKKKSWETKETAPYSDLFKLKGKFSTI